MKIRNVKKETSVGTIRASKSLGYKFKHNAAYLLLSLPALICFFIWSYLPMFGLVIAFKDYTYRDGIWGSKWVGFDNFKFFFLTNDAWRITRNTIGYGLLFLVLGVF